MQLKDNQPGTFALQPVDAAGNSAPLATGATVLWSINDPTLASLAPSTDGLSCVVTPAGKLGATKVQASIAAVGNEPAMQATGDLNVVAGDAVSVTMVGTPS